MVVPLTITVKHLGVVGAIYPIDFTKISENEILKGTIVKGISILIFMS